MKPHTCHAKGCEVVVPPAKLMCFNHWCMLPVKLQRQVLLQYRPGQEIDKQPSPEYLEAVRLAIDHVERASGFRETMEFLTHGG